MSIIRTLSRLAALAILGLMVLFAARSGVVSLLTAYAAKNNQLAAVGAALDLSHSDADAHLVRAAILEANNDLPSAVAEYKQAISARPDDYALWSSLARAQELSGDSTGAITAATEATRLAPYYAKPHWMRGNILIRVGRLDEGFAELRLAQTSDSDLLPAIIDLDWQLSAGDVDMVKRSANPHSSASYKALADFFKNHGKAMDAIEMFRAAGEDARPERRLYLQELISAKSFKEAASLWAADHSALAVAQLIDSGFEAPSNLDQPGFGWHRDRKVADPTLSLDPDNPREGHFSLRVDFSGDSDPAMGIISQLVLVEPHGRYRLRFAARQDAIVSGGLPFIVVLDPTNNAILGQTSPFSGTHTDWQDYVIDFQAGEGTGTVQVIMRRQACSPTTCPIFGHLWLDSFSLTKL